MEAQANCKDVKAAWRLFYDALHSGTACLVGTILVAPAGSCATCALRDDIDAIRSHVQQLGGFINVSHWSCLVLLVLAYILLSLTNRCKLGPTIYIYISPIFRVRAWRP